jgi:prepilin peptidase CpaA
MSQRGSAIADGAPGGVSLVPDTASLPSGAFLRSLAVGAVIAAGLVLTRELREGTPEAPLVFWGTTAFLVLVAQQDAFQRKIPNWLTGPGLLLALGYNFGTSGLRGLELGLVGAATPFVLLLVFYAGRILGAGDIKAFMALGALWGAVITLKMLAWSTLVGGGIALTIVAVRGEIPAYARRWWNILKLSVIRRRIQYEPPAANEAAAGNLPFGIAIGLGVAAYQLWGWPWG